MARPVKSPTTGIRYVGRNKTYGCWSAEKLKELLLHGPINLTVLTKVLHYGFVQYYWQNGVLRQGNIDRKEVVRRYMFGSLCN